MFAPLWYFGDRWRPSPLSPGLGDGQLLPVLRQLHRYRADKDRSSQCSAPRLCCIKRRVDGVEAGEVFVDGSDDSLLLRERCDRDCEVSDAP